MNIEVLLTEAEIAEEFAEAMEARDLPEKFFYWTPRSVNAWKELSAASGDSLRQTWEALASRSGDLTRSFNQRIPVISFGAGDGARDRLLLKGLRASGAEIKYHPVDASQTLLEFACAGAEDDDCEALGIKADISSPVHLMLAADISEPPRLFLLVGDTLGGFDALDQLRHVAECLRERDLLIVDARIRGGDQPEASSLEKEFVFAPLATTGLLPEDGELRFVENRDERHDGMYITTRRFHLSRDISVFSGIRPVHMERGERIVLNFRYSFSREAFRWLVTEHAGLKIKAEIPSADAQFVTIVCGK